MKTQPTTTKPAQAGKRQRNPTAGNWQHRAGRSERGQGIITVGFHRQVEAGYRAFWARRGLTPPTSRR